jgi:hypothetical protein
MPILQDLGLEGLGASLMLIAPPDSALAEAGAMKPRPSFATNMLTAEPAAVIAWWPEAEALTDTAWARLQWFLASAEGYALVVVDPREGLPPADEVAALAWAAGLRETARLALPAGQAVLRLEVSP